MGLNYWSFIQAILTSFIALWLESLTAEAPSWLGMVGISFGSGILWCKLQNL